MKPCVVIRTNSDAGWSWSTARATQLRAVKAEARRAKVKITIIVDIVHVLEYIWDAARAIFGESSPEAESWVGDRLLALLSGQTGG